MSKNNIETFRQKIRQGQICVGINISLSDPVISELVADAEYDFTWLDAEHGPMCVETLLAHIMVVRGTNTAPFVRVPWNDSVLIKPILELEPAGVIIPMVSTGDEAKRAVQACKYPPNGIRGFGPRRGLNFGGVDFSRYLEDADNRTLVIVQIEQAKAIENLDQILAVEGLDSICIGPMDLSASLGVTGHFDHPLFVEAVDHVIRKVRQRPHLSLGWATGYATGFDEPVVRRLIEKGVHWISLNADWSNLFYQSKKVLEHVRSIETKVSNSNDVAEKPDKRKRFVKIS